MANDNRAYRGGEFSIAFRVDPAPGTDQIPPGYSFYAEYMGPKDVPDDRKTKLSTEDSRFENGDTFILKGPVPKEASPGAYELTYFERRFEESARRERFEQDDMPHSFRELTIGAAPKGTFGIPWPEIRRTI